MREFVVKYRDASKSGETDRVAGKHCDDLRCTFQQSNLRRGHMMLEWRRRIQFVSILIFASMPIF